MQAIMIGIVSGLVSILFILLLKKMDKATIYAMILTGIGFLYVGYTWSDTISLVLNSIQAIGFLFISYFGIKNMVLLALGFFLHGAWDLVYDVLPLPDLRPPHYDLFCLSIDWVMGIYLVLLVRRRNKNIHLNPAR
ncbi:MAG: DUF6010 family protein [Bacteroidota bacterium]